MLFSTVLCSLALFVFLFILCFFLSPCLSLSLLLVFLFIFVFFCTAAEVAVAAAVMSFFIFRSQPFCVTALPNEAVPPFATFRPSCPSPGRPPLHSPFPLSAIRPLRSWSQRRFLPYSGKKVKKKEKKILANNKSKLEYSMPDFKWVKGTI